MGSGIILQSKTVTASRVPALRDESADQRGDYRVDSMAFWSQSLNAARTFKPLSESEVAALLGKTVEAAKNGQFEGYKTTTNFDGTANNPQWLG